MIHYRHEEKQHGECLASESDQESDKEPTSETADYKFNYHSLKLTFGLILMELTDAIREGDGERLFQLYKLLLLIYKNHGHYKYAYAVLMYLVKCIAILPKAHALNLKWNRFFNNNGGKGRNIPLDLKKEQQNRVLKTMWRGLGANLNEQNAQRVAGSLESVEQIYKTVDRDCDKDGTHTKREYPKQEEAVNQIISDLLEVDAFKNIPGRKDYDSFPQ